MTTLNDADAIKVGSTDVDAVYQGDVLVWSSAPPVVYSDDFNRADAPDLGADWTGVLVSSAFPPVTNGQSPIVNNQASSKFASSHLGGGIYTFIQYAAGEYLSGGGASSGMFVQADLTMEDEIATSSTLEWRVFMLDASNQGYLIHGLLDNYNDRLRLNKQSDFGSETTISDIGAGHSVADADTFRLERTGTALTVYINGVEVDSGGDSDYVPDRAVIMLTRTMTLDGSATPPWSTLRFDNFSCGPL